MPSSIVMHIENGWIESSFVNFHPFPSVMLHLKACFPCPKHKDLTCVTITLKLILLKLVLIMVNIGTNITNNLLIIPPLHGHGISQDASIHFNVVLMSRTCFKN